MSTAENVLQQKAAQSAPQQMAPQTPAVQPQQDAAPTAEPNGEVTLPEESSGGPISLHRAFSKLNSALTKLADESGVRRSATVPHQEGQSTAQHISDVGRVLANAGGLTANLLTATHSKHATDGGSTVAFPAQELRATIIPKDDENAKNAISACRSFVSKCETLIGETPEVKIAKSQINLVGKQDGAGMTVADLIIALVNIPGPVIQAVARRHDSTKEGGMHPKLRAPRP